MKDETERIRWRDLTARQKIQTAEHTLLYTPGIDTVQSNIYSSIDTVHSILPVYTPV